MKPFVYALCVSFGYMSGLVRKAAGANSVVGLGASSSVVGLSASSVVVLSVSSARTVGGDRGCSSAAIVGGDGDGPVHRQE